MRANAQRRGEAPGRLHRGGGSELEHVDSRRSVYARSPSSPISDPLPGRGARMPDRSADNGSAEEASVARADRRGRGTQARPPLVATGGSTPTGAEGTDGVSAGFRLRPKGLSA